MKRILGCVLGSMLLWGGSGLAAAQETTPPPKVLQIIREFVKPGRAGGAHEKSESAFVQAFSRAKWPTHYFAATSVTGRPRTLFFVRFDSFEEWEKDNLGQQKNAALSAALDRASMNDGDLLSDMEARLLVYNEEQSLRAAVDIAHMRYFEISVYRVKPGHRSEWNELVKMVKDAYEKVPDAHWAMYEAVYGEQGTNFLVVIPMKSTAEVDQQAERAKQFRAALGEEGLKKLEALQSSCVEFSQRNLFQFAPSMSYPPDAWVKTDPDFWKPNAAEHTKAPAKGEEKPAAKQ